MMTGTRFEDAPLSVKLLTAGTSACIADVVTFPLDTAKVRLQIQGEGKTSARHVKVAPHYRGVFSTVATIAREEGPKSLYNGLSAGLQRQMCFASIRLGMYDTVKTFYQSLIGGGEHKRAGAFDVLTRICAGVTTGAMAVLLAQPTDVVKVRFQAHHQEKEQRYRSTTEAYRTIFKVEGVRGLWKGCYPNIARNSIVNVSEIVCYDMVKDVILKHNLLPDNTICHFISAVIAGFCTTVVASPVDVIKTRYMNSPPGNYRSAVHCAMETIKKEGAFALYKGFTPSFSRLVTWNIVMWISYEKLKLLCTNHVTLHVVSDDSKEWTTSVPINEENQPKFVPSGQVSSLTDWPIINVNIVEVCFQGSSFRRNAAAVNKNNVSVYKKPGAKLHKMD